MTVYAVALLNIHDRERYGAYEAGFMEVFTKYQGTMLAVDEAPVTIEGEWPHTRTVIVEFPDKSAFDAWYKSDAYQALLQHRLAASVGSLALVAGLPSG